MHTIKKHTNKNTTSRNICKRSSNFLKTITTPIIYKQFETHVTGITNKFKKSQHKLLNEILKIKNTNEFKLTFTETILDKYNIVPPFIDIFRYLITNKDFINKFTLEEQNLLNQNLASHHSKESCYKFLEKNNLGQKIIDNYHSINFNIKSELIAKFPSIEFHNLLINSFTSFNIIEDLELRIKKLISFSVKWQNKTLDNLVYLFMYDNFDIKNTNFDYETLGSEIVKRILFFNKFLNIEKLSNKFIIFLTDKKKEIDENVVLHMHFKTININTAVTNTRDIIIYRQQELFKSIFHELIHFHNLDFRNIPQELIQYLIKTHNIKPDNEYLLYECVTEAMANILNNLFLSSNIKIFTHNLKNEILFSVLQVAKILNICGYTKWDEFARIDNIDNIDNLNNLNNSNPKKQFKQDSCVLSYYILKFYIMMNLETYFENCLDTRIKFIQTSNSFNNLKHIFDLSRNNIFIKNIIDTILINKSKSKSNMNSKKSKSTNKINKTLRMTCLESNLFSKNSI